MSDPSPIEDSDVGDDVVIQASDLTFAYEGSSRPALDCISLRVRRGELVGVMGPAGAGKSTLLHALSGVIPFFTGGSRSGRVWLDGQDLLEYAGLNAVTRRVGLVQQDPEAQLFNLYVRDEIAWGLENRGMPVPEILRTVDEVAGLFGVRHLLDRFTSTLSGGEKQRTALAAIFAFEPSIMLLDEPTSELDPIGTETVFEAGAVLAARGITVVMVEHKVEELVRFASRLVILDSGRIVADGPTRDVLRFAETALPEYLPQVFQMGMALQRYGAAIEPPVDLDEAEAMYHRLLADRDERS